MFASRAELSAGGVGPMRRVTEGVAVTEIGTFCAHAAYKLTAPLGDEKRETRNIDRTQSPLVMEAFDLPYDKGKDHQFLHVKVNHNSASRAFCG